MLKEISRFKKSYRIDLPPLMTRRYQIGGEYIQGWEVNPSGDIRIQTDSAHYTQLGLAQALDAFDGFKECIRDNEHRLISLLPVFDVEDGTVLVTVQDYTSGDETLHEFTSIQFAFLEFPRLMNGFNGEYGRFIYGEWTPEGSDPRVHFMRIPTGAV